VIASLLLMRPPPRKRTAGDKHVIEELRDGVRYAFGFAPIRSVLLLLALVSLMGMPNTVLMPVMAAGVLHGGPHALGFLWRRRASGRWAARSTWRRAGRCWGSAVWR